VLLVWGEWLLCFELIVEPEFFLLRRLFTHISRLRRKMGCRLSAISLHEPRELYGMSIKSKSISCIFKFSFAISNAVPCRGSMDGEHKLYSSSQDLIEVRTM
jgi:hypothetical protein